MKSGVLNIMHRMNVFAQRFFMPCGHSCYRTVFIRIALVCKSCMLVQCSRMFKMPKG